MDPVYGFKKPPGCQFCESQGHVHAKCHKIVKYNGYAIPHGKDGNGPRLRLELVSKIPDPLSTLLIEMVPNNFSLE